MATVTDPLTKNHVAVLKCVPNAARRQARVFQIAPGLSDIQASPQDLLHTEERFQPRRDAPDITDRDETSQAMTSQNGCNSLAIIDDCLQVSRSVETKTFGVQVCSSIHGALFIRRSIYRRRPSYKQTPITALII